MRESTSYVSGNSLSILNATNNISGQNPYGFSRGNDSIVNPLLGIPIVTPLLVISEIHTETTDTELYSHIPSEYDINPSLLEGSHSVDLEQYDLNQGSNFTLDFQRDVKRYHNPTLHSQACSKGLSFVKS